MSKTLICIFLFAVLAFKAEAELYRWVDDYGEVHYSDNKPDRQHEVIEVKERTKPEGVDLVPHLKLEILPSPFKRPDPIVFLNEFRALAPLPQWWQEVELKPGLKYKTHADLLAIWGSEKRCCDKDSVREANRRMFKAAYNSILEYNGDEHALAFALSRLNVNYVDYPQQMEVQQLALKYFFYYRQKLDWCVCKPGDHTARQIYFLGQQYRVQGQHLAYAALIRKFIRERESETSRYAIAELYRQLAEAYVREEHYNIAVAVLDEALAKLDTEYGSPAHLSEVRSMKKRREYINKHYRRK